MTKKIVRASCIGTLVRHVWLAGMYALLVTATGVIFHREGLVNEYNKEMVSQL